MAANRLELLKGANDEVARLKAHDDQALARVGWGLAIVAAAMGAALGLATDLARRQGESIPMSEAADIVFSGMALYWVMLILPSYRLVTTRWATGLPELIRPGAPIVLSSTTRLAAYVSGGYLLLHDSSLWVKALIVLFFAFEALFFIAIEVRLLSREGLTELLKIRTTWSVLTGQAKLDTSDAGGSDAPPRLSYGKFRTFTFLAYPFARGAALGSILVMGSLNALRHSEYVNALLLEGAAIVILIGFAGLIAHLALQQLSEYDTIEQNGVKLIRNKFLIEDWKGAAEYESALVAFYRNPLNLSSILETGTKTREEASPAVPATAQVPSPKGSAKPASPSKKPKLLPIDIAIATGVCMFMGAFSSFFVATSNGALLAGLPSAAMALFFYGTGTALLIASIGVSIVRKEPRLFWISFLGWAVGGAMAGVVQYERANFYSAATGLFASFILALAATRLATPDRQKQPDEAD